MRCFAQWSSLPCSAFLPGILQARLDSFAARNPGGVLQQQPAPAASVAAKPSQGSSGPTKSLFNLLAWTKAQRAFVAAGEPVGVLAAQGVGEPSTQVGFGINGSACKCLVVVIERRELGHCRTHALSCCR
jgi:hypothetical protein